MLDRTLLSPVRLALAIGLAFLMAATAIIAPHSVRAGAAGQKVVIIVGPVGGGSIQTNYLNRGESIADAVEAMGGTAVRVFSPNATWANARAAVNGANIIVYIGHGSGYPNPYGSTLLTDRTNGWGLNRIAGVDAADPTGHGHNLSTQMVYCGEAAIEGKPLTSYNSAYCSGGPITPAPGFVMVFSNACYAPGAGETEETTPSSQATARARVQYYSRAFLALGGTYFASDLGSQSVVEAILENPDIAFGDIFRLGNGYSDTAVRGFSHALSPGKQAWIQKTSGPGGLMSYWYAFAGDPARTPAGGTASYVPLPPAPDDTPPTIAVLNPAYGATGVSTMPTVRVTFSENVVGVSAGNTVLRDHATSVVVPSTVTYDPATWTASLVPNAPLQGNRLYRMAASGSIVDTAGNPLAFVQWYFTTGAGAPPPPPPPPPEGGVYDPPVSMNFAYGSHTGYRFDAAGVVTGSKTATLGAWSSAATSQRTTLPGQTGTWYYVTNGIWAGYWVRESSRAYVAGYHDQVTFSPWRSVSFAAGSHTGYAFSASGAVTGSKAYTLGSGSSASASGRAVINGRSYVLVANGVWAGYWVPESSAVVLN